MQETFALEVCQMKLCKVLGFDDYRKQATVLTETIVNAVNITFYGY